MNRTELAVAIGQLAEGEQRWAVLSLADRVQLLREVHSVVAAQARPWAEAACAAKGLPVDSPLAGEEWLTGPCATLVALARLMDTLTAISQGRSPIADLELGHAPGGRLTVPVLPADRFDRLLLNGFRADVWLRRGVTADQARASAGLGALRPGRTGGIGLVLGAGNISCIAPLDALYELIAHNRVVLLKLNPTLDLLVGPLSAALAPLIDLGVLRIVTGGADVGEYLVHHPDIAHVHITGSAATHDRIVWGAGDSARQRRHAGKPLLDKPITSELGGVSPIIVLPGRWSKADLAFQAEHIATTRLHNGGYNCIAGQVVIVSADWPQADALIEQIRIAMERAPARPAWYPGSANRIADAIAAYPSAELLGRKSRVLIDRPVDPKALSTNEYFAPVLGVVALGGSGSAYSAAATEYANNHLVGTLGANILAAPHTIAAMGSQLDEMVAALHYGTVAINAWTGVGFLTPGASWGAYPGHHLHDVQSGIGLVHNGFLLDDVERTVVRGPFRPLRRALAGGGSLTPRPPWFTSARTGRRTAELLTKFAAERSARTLPAVVLSALRG